MDQAIQIFNDFIINNPSKGLFVISIIILILATLSTLGISLLKINTDKGNKKISLFIMFLSALSIYYFYGKLTTHLETEVVKPQAVVTIPQTRTTESITQPSLDHRSNQEIVFEDSLVRFINDLNHKRYDRSWKYIGRFYQKNIIKKKNGSATNELESLNHFKNTFKGVKHVKANNIDKTNKTAVIYIIYKSGSEEQKKIKIVKDIQINKIYGGWYISDIKNIKKDAIVDISNWKKDWKEKLHITKIPIKIPTPKGQLVLDEPVLTTKNKQFKRDSLSIDHAQGYITTKEGRFYITKYSWDAVNKNKIKYPKWIYAIH